MMPRKFNKKYFYDTWDAMIQQTDGLFSKNLEGNYLKLDKYPDRYLHN